MKGQSVLSLLGIPVALLTAVVVVGAAVYGVVELVRSSGWWGLLAALAVPLLIAAAAGWGALRPVLRFRAR